MPDPISAATDPFKMKTSTTILSGLWSTYRVPLLFTAISLAVFLVLLSRIDSIHDRRIFQADLATAKSAARAWAGLNCAHPPMEQMGLANVLNEVRWTDRLYDEGAWSVLLTTGPDYVCTGAMILYSGYLVDSTDATTQRLFRNKCASRQGTGDIGFPVRPTVMTGPQGEYHLRWDTGTRRDC